MAVYSDQKIYEALFDKKLVINPLMHEHIQPSSIDLTLDNVIKVPVNNIGRTINVYDEDMDKYFKTRKIDEYILESGDMILAQIREKIQLARNMTGRIENRNSLTRIGLDVSLSSYINPGYKGQLAIVIKNTGKFDISLVKGMRICQLIIHDVCPTPFKDYSQKEDSKYYNESNLITSRLYLDKEYKEYFKNHSKIAKEKFDKVHLGDFFIKRIEECKVTDVLESLDEETKAKLGID